MTTVGTGTASRGTGGGDEVEQKARDVHDSKAVDLLARVGLGSRGVVWLVIGLLSASVALGGSERTDQQGALRAIADKPFGEVLLVVLAVGFAGYALSLLLSAAVGHRSAPSDKRTKARVESGLKAVVYVVLSAAVVRFLSSGGQSEGDPTSSLTADLMSRPGGRWLVGLVGLAVIALGVRFVVKAVQGKHAEKIEAWKVPDGRARTAVKIGTVGLVGRGLVLALIGGFLVSAALQADPSEAKGLDAALATLSQQAFGKVLLGLAVVGMLAYAVWSFVEAAFHKHD